jgi:hypothetical protein
MTYTRKDYMDRKISHEIYYDQFVTPAVTHLVNQYIGHDKVRASTDPHFGPSYTLPGRVFVAGDPKGR